MGFNFKDSIKNKILFALSVRVGGFAGRLWLSSIVFRGSPSAPRECRAAFRGKGLRWVPKGTAIARVSCSDADGLERPKQDKCIRADTFVQGSSSKFFLQILKFPI
jgi:hypothetical protein